MILHHLELGWLHSTRQEASYYYCLSNRKNGTDLQVDNGTKLAEMLVEFADVVELGGNLPNQQLGVKREWDPFIEALVVWFVKVWSAQRRKMNPLFSHEGV